MLTAPEDTEKCEEEKDATPFADVVASSPATVSVEPVAEVLRPEPPVTVRLSESKSMSIVPLSEITSKSCAVTCASTYVLTAPCVANRVALPVARVALSIPVSVAPVANSRLVSPFKVVPVMAAADKFTIKIKGIGGHGAAPQGTVDCVVVASHLIQTLQTIVSRNSNPLENTVVTIGQINGGYNFNIIADKVILKGTTRAYTEKNRSLIKSRMNDIIKGTEKTFGAQIILDYNDGYPPVINNNKLVNNLNKAAQHVVGKTNVSEPYLSMGGEDFSYFANKIPGCFFFLGSAPINKKPLSVPHHCSHFDIDENAMLIGSSIFIKLIENISFK